MKVLVLGSSGQIGRYLSDYLVSKNYEVINFDILNNSEEDLRKIPNKYLEKCVFECDFVFFLAFDGGSKIFKKISKHF